MVTIALGLGWVGSEGKLLCERYTSYHFLGSISTTKFTSNSAFSFSSPPPPLFHMIGTTTRFNLESVVALTKGVVVLTIPYKKSLISMGDKKFVKKKLKIKST